MGGYLLLIELDADLAADALQLPPVGLVKSLNLVHIVGWLLQFSLSRRLKNSHYELDPVVELVRLNEERH